MGFRIIGTGRYLPKQILTNDELSTRVDTTDAWIVSHTGIRSRYIMTEAESALDAVRAAAERALASAGLRGDEIDLILCSTCRGDFFTPSLACLLQEAIGAKCPAFDLNAACSGFIYALDIADKYFTCPDYRRILIVSYERMSTMVNWQDRSTCVLFGDGCGGAVVENCPDNPALIRLGAKGTSKILHIPNRAGVEPHVYMEGQAVFKFAVSSGLREIPQILRQAGWAPEDVTHVLLHQANMRIIDAVAEKLPIPRDRYRTNVETHGNTSSACIPTLLDELAEEGRLQRGDRLLLYVFGGGMTTGGAAFCW